MILTEDEVIERVSSPMNLLNRLRTAVSPHKATHPSLPPKASDIIPDIDQKIGLGSVKAKAVSIMTGAMTELEKRLPDVQRPEKLAAIAAEMGKVVNGMESKERGPTVGQIIIYSPQIVSESEFDVVDVSGIEQ